MSVLYNLPLNDYNYDDNISNKANSPLAGSNTTKQTINTWLFKHLNEQVVDSDLK